MTITYTDFKKIATLTEGNKNYTLTYGVDDERRKSEYTVGGVLQKTRYYLGDYEEEVDAATGNVRKIHYLSGGAMLVNDNGVETLYYGYYDYQGSLLALTDANGTIVEKYAYDPWGARRNPTDWSQKDTRTSWLNNRGYTGHEHIDAFNIINMNGRVYDPLTSMFLSPDPYVQAPDNWLNYNRYSYAFGNPFKYTDPSGNLQLGFFYLSFNIGYSANGGMSVGISAGIGIENVASVGISINHNLQNGSWSFTGNVGVAGAYAYAGYDTKGGFIAGAGYSFTSMFAGLSPVNISTNMTSMGAGYSANGGWGYNYMGAQFDKNWKFTGFDPSIGVSYTLTYNPKTVVSEVDNLGTVEKEYAEIGTNEQKDAVLNDNNVDLSYYNVKNIDLENTDFTMIKNEKYRRINGVIQKQNKNGGWTIVGGLTVSPKGFNPKSSIYMSSTNTVINFKIVLNHEFIHSWQYAHLRNKFASDDEFNSFTETSAYMDTRIYHPDIRMPSSISQYKGPINLYYLPRLMPIK